MRSCQSPQYFAISVILLVLLLFFSSSVNSNLNSSEQYSYRQLVSRNDPDLYNSTLTVKTATVSADQKGGSTDASKRLNIEDEHNKIDGKPTITTEVNIIYTTVIYQSASSITSVSTAVPVHNMTNVGSAHQEGERQPDIESSSNSTNPAVSGNTNSNNNIAENLKDDQQALKRMVMIVSLVGGIGFIAVATTIVIFTRMRIKNRKDREMGERDLSSTFELYSNHLGRGSNNNSNNHSGSSASSSAGNTHIESSVNSTDPQRHHSHNHRHQYNSSDCSSSNEASARSQPSTDIRLMNTTEPSAPPLTIERHVAPAEQLHQHYSQRYHLDINSSTLPEAQRQRRYVLSMSSQTSAPPTPSAPTAKELDAMIEDDHHQHYPTTSSHRFNTHHHHHNCPNCSPYSVSSSTTPTVAASAPYPIPEIPPPAYTPTAPPYYALPIEATTALVYAENNDMLSASATADRGTDSMVHSNSENNISGMSSDTIALAISEGLSAPPALPPRRHSTGT